MGKILLDLHTPDLVKALEANLQAHVILYASLPGAMVYDEPGILGLMTDLDFSESCIYRANLTPGQASGKIEEVLRRYRSQGCLPMWWIVGPSSQPADLGKYLQACGCQYFAHPPGMIASLQDLEQQTAFPSELVIERVVNSIQLMQWTEIVQIADGISASLKVGFYELFNHQGFGLDAPCSLFLGMVHDRPVAASRLFPAGGIAGIYHVATLPEVRGRRFGTAMTLAAAHAGRELGYQVGGLFATPAGYSMYHRLGFQEICTMDVYQSTTYSFGMEGKDT